MKKAWKFEQPINVSWFIIIRKQVLLYHTFWDLGLFSLNFGRDGYPLSDRACWSKWLVINKLIIPASVNWLQDGEFQNDVSFPAISEHGRKYIFADYDEQ